MEFKDVCNEFISKLTPRLLGFLDRTTKPDSSTAGCFDRYYWHYKLHDIANSRFQEAAFLLFYLYNSCKYSEYHKNSKIFEWLQNSVFYWQSIMNSDGSFNEVYPFERSFCATSFSASVITDVLLKDSNVKFNLFKLIKTGDWLSKNCNHHIANQKAASVLALYNISILTGKKKFENSADERLWELIQEFRNKKFFPEYGGFDIGYQTITLSVLTDCYIKNKNEELKKVIEDCLSILNSKIADNGKYNYLETSRQTQYLYPYSFSVFHQELLNKTLNGIKLNQIITPFWLDDRYCIGLLNDYIKIAAAAE